ncbi:MAG: acyl-CoA thioesterase [Aeromicrobium sp.]
MVSIGDSLALRPDGDGRWIAHAEPDHQSITGMFGGWTAGVLLNAVIRTADGTAMPSAMTVNYIGAISPGDDVLVTVGHVGGGRSINHWRAEVRPTNDTAVLATATVAMTARRPSPPHQQLQMPDAPDPDSLDRVYAPSPQGLNSDLRHASGTWDYETGDSRDCMWVRDAVGRPLDHLTLAYLADQYAPRSFYFGGGPGPSATITMSVYFHATDDEIAAVGDDYILNEATGTRGEHSTSGQQANLWRRDGTLLGTTEQLCWYR